MKRYLIILLLIPFMTLFSCTEDTSAYLPQNREDVDVDDAKNEQEEEEEEELPEGQLVPGVHLVKLNVTQPDGQTVERRFKYFMPVSIDARLPISLIFEFHGSHTFGKGERPANPIESISSSNPLAQNAIKENCVVCFPAGEVVYSADSSGTVDWHVSENQLPFVDAMIDYFKGCTPTIDANRIYSTGQSSGAIFSFVLAFQRSTVFAAITPRAGQMSLENQTQMPERAVPVRLFAGDQDTTVRYEAVLKNMTAWAERIGGYFAADAVVTEDSIEIENYKKVDTRIWSGGNTDLQIYTLKDQDHYIALNYCLPYMWEFMASHTLDQQTKGCFVTSEIKQIAARCGETISFSINYTDGATVTLEDAPYGWNTKLENKKITLTGPQDFGGDIDREGEMTIKVTKDGSTASMRIFYSLEEPVSYFKVGDIYYNEKYEPVGVVCRVNRANFREAIIIHIDEQKSTWYCGNDTGLGIDFDTPDKDDGYSNTQQMITFNNTLATPYTATTAAFMWAASLEYKGVGDWYLPAINELEAIAKNLAKINEAIKSVKGTEIKAGSILYSSTTEVKEGATTKTIYSYNYTTDQVVANMARDAGSEYFGYINVRAVRRVTMP